ncbi:MAG TPA: amino acid ABC transporter permease [Candidatus Dormibacteraeota bacterium]|nr:amino acid ABC transporter permease [Candidatus Dormibacteraeota bacterium]
MSELLTGGLVTLEVATGAWAVSVTFGLLLAMLREVGVPGMRWPALVTTTALRSVPQLVVLYILYFGLGAVGINVPPLLAAIVGLGITDGAFSAEYYRASLLTVSASQRDAGYSVGLSRVATFRRVVMPQAVPYMVPPWLNSFVGLLKTATLASAVGVPEILYDGSNIIDQTGKIVYVMVIIILIYVVVTMPLARFVGILESRRRTTVGT